MEQNLPSLSAEWELLQSTGKPSLYPTGLEVMIFCTPVGWLSYCGAGLMESYIRLMQACQSDTVQRLFHSTLYSCTSPSPIINVD